MGVTSVLNSSIGRITLSRHRAHTDLCHEAPVAEDIVLEGNLLRHLLRASGEERAARPAPRLELPARHSRPAALSADAVHHRGVGWEVLVARTLGHLGHVGVRRRSQEACSKGMSWAPSQRVISPRGRRFSLPSVTVRKWLPASCPSLLAKIVPA